MVKKKRTRMSMMSHMLDEDADEYGDDDEGEGVDEGHDKEDADTDRYGRHEMM